MTKTTFAKIRKLNLTGLAFKKRASFRAVFDESKPEVRTVMAALRAFCPTDASRNAGAPIDTNQVFINIGKRQVLSYIMAQINMPDERLEQIAREETSYGR